MLTIFRAERGVSLDKFLWNEQKNLFSQWLLERSGNQWMENFCVHNQREAAIREACCDNHRIQSQDARPDFQRLGRERYLLHSRFVPLIQFKHENWLVIQVTIPWANVFGKQKSFVCVWSLGNWCPGLVRQKKILSGNTLDRNSLMKMSWLDFQWKWIFQSDAKALWDKCIVWAKRNIQCDLKEANRPGLCKSKRKSAACFRWGERFHLANPFLLCQLFARTWIRFPRRLSWGQKVWKLCAKPWSSYKYRSAKTWIRFPPVWN